MPHRTTWLAAAAVALGAAVLAASGSWIPSVWYDEAATVTMVTRPWPELWRTVGSVDAVHALYYAAMHVVVDVVGYSPLALRLPSAVAVGATAALLVPLGRRLVDLRTGVVAGIVCALLPRMTWAGTEARSYALTALLAVAATLLLVVALQTARRRWWIAYVAVAVLGCVLFVYAATLVVAHVVALAAIAAVRRGRSDLVALLRGGVAATVTAAVVAPFGAVVVAQSAQVSWLPRFDELTPWLALVAPWFTGSFELARVEPRVAHAALALALVVAVLGIAGVVAAARRRNVTAVAIAVAWALVPGAALMAATAAGTPLFSPRYLAFAAPAVALLVGFASMLVPRPGRRWIGAALVGLAVLCAPQYVVQRAPEAKQSSSWAQVAHWFDEQVGEGAQADRVGIVWGEVWGHPRATARVIRYAYPDPFAGTVDVTLDTPAAESGALWETTIALDSATARARLDDTDTVYLVTSTSRDIRDEVTTQLSLEGFEPAAQTEFTDVNVVRYVRVG